MVQFVARLRKIDAGVTAFRSACAAIKGLWRAMGGDEEVLITSTLAMFALLALMSFGAYLAMKVEHAIAVFNHVFVL
ncbi:MAG: hypothetical protein WA418_34900 [Bradyrhizobium sp.]